MLKTRPAFPAVDSAVAVAGMHIGNGCSLFGSDVLVTWSPITG